MKRLQSVMMLIFALPLITYSLTADAGKRAGYKQIRIESRFDPHKYIIAPIRPNRHGGLEVRLPGGTWIDCQKNCHWTVQKQYLDFFHYQQNPFGPGYIRFYF